MVATTLGVALGGYLSGFALGLGLLARNRPGTTSPVWMLSLGAFLVHTVSLGVACSVYGGWPVGANSESFSFIAWATVLFGLVAVWRYRAPVLLSFLLPPVTLMAATALLLTGDAEGLRAIPRGAWLWAHIALSLLSVGALLVAAIAGITYLLLERQLKSRRPGFLFRRLPPLEVCDRLQTAAMAVGFGLLTAGVLAGLVGLWSSLQLRWSWDLTRGLALTGWALYLAVLVWRWSVGLRGRKAAYMTIAGTVAVAGTLVGVLLAGGFHPGG